MNGLEQTFYIMAIVYMGIMFIVVIAAVVAIFAIKAKINAIHDKIDRKLGPLLTAIHAGESIARAAKAAVQRK